MRVGGFLWPAAHLSPRRLLRLLLFPLAVSLFCGVATGTSETSLRSCADFEADAARHSHLPVASGTPVSSRHCHGLWDAALKKCGASATVSRLRGVLVVLPSPRSRPPRKLRLCHDLGHRAILGREPSRKSLTTASSQVKTTSRSKTKNIFKDRPGKNAARPLESPGDVPSRILQRPSLNLDDTRWS